MLSEAQLVPLQSKKAGAPIVPPPRSQGRKGVHKSRKTYIMPGFLNLPEPQPKPQTELKSVATGNVWAEKEREMQSKWAQKREETERDEEKKRQDQEANKQRIMEQEENTQRQKLLDKYDYESKGRVCSLAVFHLVQFLYRQGQVGVCVWKDDRVIRHNIQHNYEGGDRTDLDFRAKVEAKYKADVAEFEAQVEAKRQVRNIRIKDLINEQTFKELQNVVRQIVRSDKQTSVNKRSNPMTKNRQKPKTPKQRVPLWTMTVVPVQKPFSRMDPRPLQLALSTIPTVACMMVV